MTVAMPRERRSSADAVTLDDALAVLAAGDRLHRAAGEDDLVATTVGTLRDLLGGAAVACGRAPAAAVDAVTASEVRRVVRPAVGAPLLLTVRLVGPREARLVALVAAQLASALELVRLRAAAAPPVTAPLHRLTPREREVLALVARGETNAEAGAHLGIGPRTVEKHLEHIAVKLDARGRTAASAAYLSALVR